MAPTPEIDVREDVFTLIPPRTEEFEPPTYERPYAVNRQADLDAEKLAELLKLRDSLNTASPPDDPCANDGLFEPMSTPLMSTPLTPASAEAKPADPTPAEPVTIPPPTERLVAPVPALTAPERVDPIAERRDGIGMDLTRMAIRDGCLYWDGHPVEVRRTVSLSRAQVVGLSLIGVFAFVAALGAAVQATAVAHDWGCRLGVFERHCTPGSHAQIRL